MVPLEEYKISLDDEVKNLTEEQILKLQENQDQMAEIFFNMWLKEINNKSV